jgi:hypothetical protein
LVLSIGTASLDVIDVPPYTDFKLHDMTDPDDESIAVTPRFARDD